MPPTPSRLTRVYYRVKPYVPQRLRWALRRQRARRILRGNPPNWPIDEAAGAMPDGWPGWPDGKDFAFVLTHDVESQAGLDKVRALAELEMELGFRSSFNFIPEGEYRVPEDLRHWLTENGFEVGVHDLHHDGHLYRSREEFRAKALRINRYLKEWGAVGFRSGFMLRNLDWLHDLDISYDASTFDTDPFEPQPDGAGTIFPFLIQKGAHSYVELPYTLPQDSTVFLLLRESSPQIWIRKLDWLVAKGAMALLNIHPDYVNFEGANAEAHTFPASYYQEFLRHVSRRFSGQYWAALPRQVSQYAAASLPVSPSREPKRVCMVAFTDYESDNRVLRYAETLAARGAAVDVLDASGAKGRPGEEMVRGVRLIRLGDRSGPPPKGRLGHLLPVLRYLWACSRWIKRTHRQQPYDLLHIHNMPDFLAFAGRYAKRKGARVILDIHDLMPEFYDSKFASKTGRFTRSILLWLERASARLADHVIIANDLWRERYEERTGTRGRCSAFINNVDSSLFVPHARDRQDGKLIALFPGTLQWHQGVDIAIEAFRVVHRRFPNAEFHIYGGGIAKEALIRQAREAGLNGSVRFFEPRSLHEIAKIMANADLGVVPKRADSFGDEAYSTKIMEFMAVGVPAVISSTKIDRHYFDDSVVRFFDSGDAQALAREMIDLLSHPEKRRQQAARALEYAKEHCWNSRKDAYLQIVDSLCAVR